MGILAPMPTSRPVSARSTPQQTTTNNSNLLTYVGIGTQDKWNSRHKIDRWSTTTTLINVLQPSPQLQRQHHKQNNSSTITSAPQPAYLSQQQPQQQQNNIIIIASLIIIIISSSSQNHLTADQVTTHRWHQHKYQTTAASVLHSAHHCKNEAYLWK